MDLRTCFNVETSHNHNPKVLVTAVELPTGAIEIITNTEAIPEKIEYIKENYNKDFVHANGQVKIVGYMLV